MDKIENLYIVASEECAEMQQCISKILRFGGSSHHPDKPDKTNETELFTEYYQLQSVMEMIMDSVAFPNMTARDINSIKLQKKCKVIEYAELSKSLGRIVWLQY